MTCAACGTPFESRRKDHRFCSAKCRLVGFQRKQENERRERDAKVRLLLKEALDSPAAKHVRQPLREMLTLLEPEKEPSR